MDDGHFIVLPLLLCHLVSEFFTPGKKKKKSIIAAV
jgi:hypothetical protein